MIERDVSFVLEPILESEVVARSAVGSGQVGDVFFPERHGKLRRGDQSLMFGFHTPVLDDAQTRRFRPSNGLVVVNA